MMKQQFGNTYNVISVTTLKNKAKLKIITLVPVKETLNIYTLFTMLIAVDAVLVESLCMKSSPFSLDH